MRIFKTRRGAQIPPPRRSAAIRSPAFKKNKNPPKDPRPMEGPLALLRRYGHDADPAVLAILHADLDPELKATLLRNHIARLDLPELSPVPVVGGVLPHPSPPPAEAAPASLNGRFKLSDPRLDAAPTPVREARARLRILIPQMGGIHARLKSLRPEDALLARTLIAQLASLARERRALWQMVDHHLEALQ